jgi:hypothetical protein
MHEIELQLMILKQLTDQPIPLVLTLIGAPVSGVMFSNIILEMLKPGASSWSLITDFVSGDLVEVGAGYYSLSMHGHDINILGPNLLRVRSMTSLFDTQVISLDVIARTREEVQPANQCLLFGDLISADGSPSKDEEIFIRIVDFPFSSSASLATTKASVTRSNGNGHFEINLLRLSTVMIEIPVSGVRKQFVVPDQSTIALVDAMNL